tara:strand:- start:3180 stop:3608 length:429 start_codon:yes stop_codon:yes gene_type:complete
MGNSGEKSILDILKSKYPTVKKDAYEYAIFDFVERDEDNKIIRVFELKTRNAFIDTYPDFCFGKNKLDKANELLEQKIEVYFLWYLKDNNKIGNRQLYYWRYSKDTNKKEYYIGEIKNTFLNQTAKPAVFVKTKYLSKIDFL